jgi:hypothetical protein
MKHFSKKKYLQGAGWLSGPRIPDPKPSILREPNLGGYRILQSYSVAEIIDLISDGPIHGLVDKNGKDVNRGGGSLLQSVYLDNTPVQNTSDTDYDLSKISLGSVDISSTLKQLGDIYYQPNTPTTEAEYKRFTLDYNPENKYNYSTFKRIHNVNNERLLFGHAYYGLILATELPGLFKFGWESTAGDCLVQKKFPLGSWDIISKNYSARNGTISTEIRYDYIPILFTKQFDTKKIEINMSESSLASEGLLKEYNQELDTKLSLASTNQKYFINLVKSKINTLNLLKRGTHIFTNEAYNKFSALSNGTNFQTGEDITNRNLFQYEKDLYITVNLGDFSIPALNGKSIFKKDSEENLTNEINEFSFALESFV